MREYYEGSIAPLGTEDWTEPCDVFVASEEIAAQKVIERNLAYNEVGENEFVRITVRKITLKGKPLGEWEHYTGRARAVYHSQVKSVLADNI